MAPGQRQVTRSARVLTAGCLLRRLDPSLDRPNSYRKEKSLLVDESRSVMAARRSGGNPHSQVAASEVTESFHSGLNNGLRVELANAVSSELEGRLISADNQSLGRWVTIDEAVERDACFAVPVRDDVLALDCDKPEGVETLWEVRDFLAGFGIESVVLESGQEGHLHLFAWVPHPALRKTAGAMARAAKIDVRTGAFLRPPLIRHRLDYPVNLLQPTNAEAALRALLSTPLDLDDRVSRAGPDPLEPDAMGGREAEWADTEDNREKQPLSPRMQQLLAKGDIHGVYPSRSEVIQAITTDAVRQGWNLTEVFEVLMYPKNVGGERLHEIAERSGDEAALAWLEPGYTKAEDYINRVASVSGERLSHWSRYATRAITGRSATSDRLILQPC